MSLQNKVLDEIATAENKALMFDIAYVKRVLESNRHMGADDGTALQRFEKVVMAIPGMTEDLYRCGELPQEGENIEPHELFSHFRPDEVAGCWNGVDEKLYCALWGVMKYVPSQLRSGRLDRSLAAYWDKLSKTDQKILNQLAENNCR